jgi:hypothetical protein
MHWWKLFCSWKRIFTIQTGSPPIFCYKVAFDQLDHIIKWLFIRQQNDALEFTIILFIIMVLHKKKNDNFGKNNINYVSLLWSQQKKTYESSSLI